MMKKAIEKALKNTNKKKSKKILKQAKKAKSTEDIYKLLFDYNLSKEAIKIAVSRNEVSKVCDCFVFWMLHKQMGEISKTFNNFFKSMNKYIEQEDFPSTDYIVHNIKKKNAERMKVICNQIETNCKN